MSSGSTATSRGLGAASFPAAPHGRAVDRGFAHCDTRLVMSSNGCLVLDGAATGSDAGQVGQCSVRVVELE